MPDEPSRDETSRDDCRDRDERPSIADDLRSTVWHRRCRCELHVGTVGGLRVNWRHDCPMHGPELSELRAATAAVALEPLDHAYLRYYRRSRAAD